MDRITICPSCQTPWAVVPDILKAHPGRQSAPTRVRVPLSDAYGESVGVRWQTSAHWLSAGESKVIHALPDDGGPTVRYAWDCHCGQALSWLEPAWDVVPCLHGGQPCKKARGRTWDQKRASWQACPCCGHQGTHVVLRDGSTPAPCHPVKVGS